MNDTTKLLRGYLDELDEARESVQALEDDAQRVNDQADARRASQERTTALQTQAAELRAERESLQADYTASLFEGNTAEQRNITTRRKKIDAELNRIEKDIRAEHGSEGADAGELAELTILRDRLLNPPTVENLIAELEGLLEVQRDELRERVRAVVLPRGMDQKRYHELKEQTDPAYAAVMRRERHLAKKDAERTAKIYARAESILRPPSPPDDREVELTTK